MQKKANEEKEKERKKREKKGDTIRVKPTKFLTMNVDVSSAFDIYRNIYLSFEEPVASIDTAAIHMEVKVDSVWQPAPFFFMADSLMPRQYQILADWQPEQEYQLTIDSLAFIGVYGLHTEQSPVNGESEENGRVRELSVEYKRSCSPCCCRVVGCEWKCIVPTTGNGGEEQWTSTFLKSEYEILYTFC